MSNAQNPTVHVPVKASYLVVGDKITLVSAVYADIPADTIARMLAGHFNIPTGPPPAFAADDGKGVV